MGHGVSPLILKAIALDFLATVCQTGREIVLTITVRIGGGI